MRRRRGGDDGRRCDDDATRQRCDTTMRTQRRRGRVAAALRRPSQSNTRDNDLARMVPLKCCHRNAATEMSPPKCRHRNVPPKCRHRNVATEPRRGGTRRGGDDNSLAPAAAPTGHVAPAQVLQPRCSAQVPLLPLTSDPRGWVRIAVEVRNEATTTARPRRDDDATTAGSRCSPQALSQSLQPPGALTSDVAAPQVSSQKLQCPGALRVAADPSCLHRSCSAQVPSQSLQSSGALTVAAAPTSLPVPQPSGALTVLAAAFPHRPHCSPSLKMGEDSGKVRRRDDAATTKRRRRRDVMTVLENLTLWFRDLQVPDQSIRGRDLQMC